MNEDWLTAKKIFNLEALPTFTFITFLFIAYLEIVKTVSLHSSISCNFRSLLNITVVKKEPIVQKLDWSEEAKRSLSMAVLSSDRKEKRMQLDLISSQHCKYQVWGGKIFLGML